VVAPSAAVAANSDGNRNTAGDGNEFGVQCGLSSSASTSMFGCDVLQSEIYLPSAATIQKTGSSVAAAFIAGAAVMIRQYLADGIYPSGVRLPSRDNLPASVVSSRGAAPSDNPWARPPAALVKAMIIHSAQSVGGKTNVNNYYPDPACDPLELEEGERCPLLYSTTRDVLGENPNMFEGFGRPKLDSVLWFADSKWSLLLLQNKVLDKPGWMHTYGFRLLESSTLPFKVTMCYTDPPSAPGASEVLVNDLDMIVQRMTTVMVLNTSLGRKVPTDVFERAYGNARGGAAKDGYNTCEVFALPEHSESVVTVIVVAFRLAQKPQAYSLVATGLIRPKYHAWITAAEGKVRQYVLDLVQASNDAGWREFDLFKRGKAQGLTLSDLGVIFPAEPTPSAQGPCCVSEDILLSMLTEADDNGDRRLDFTEFVAVVTELATGAIRSAEPLFTEEEAPAEFLAATTANETDATESHARRRYAAGALVPCCLLVSVLCNLLSAMVCYG